MIDFNSEIGKEAKRLLDGEYVVWLTTVGSDLTPQPRPVWFIWDGDAVLIYSKPTAAKLKHIAQHPKVALHFNADYEANNSVLVVTGTAIANPAAPSALSVPAYMAKYTEGIGNIGMKPESFAKTYSVAIRVTPERLRE